MYTFQAKSETNKNKQMSDDTLPNAHLLPFKIEKDGPAKVKEYFESIIVQSNNTDNTQKASLYGREVFAKQIQLPEGIQAHQFIRNSANFERIKFNEINKCNIYEWKHDEKPNNSDKLQSSVVYLSIMSELSKE